MSDGRMSERTYAAQDEYEGLTPEQIAMVKALPIQERAGAIYKLKEGSVLQKAASKLTPFPKGTPPQGTSTVKQPVVSTPATAAQIAEGAGRAGTAPLQAQARPGAVPVQEPVDAVTGVVGNVNKMGPAEAPYPTRVATPPVTKAGTGAGGTGTGGATPPPPAAPTTETPMENPFANAGSGLTGDRESIMAAIRGGAPKSEASPYVASKPEPTGDPKKDDVRGMLAELLPMLLGAGGDYFAGKALSSKPRNYERRFEMQKLKSEQEQALKMQEGQFGQESKMQTQKAILDSNLLLLDQLGKQQLAELEKKYETMAEEYIKKGVDNPAALKFMKEQFKQESLILDQRIKVQAQAVMEQYSAKAGLEATLAEWGFNMKPRTE